MAEDHSEDDVGPTIHKNYRVFEVTVSGGPEDTLEDVQEIHDEEVEQAKQDVEDLKRIDFKLDEEFDADRQAARGPGGMHQ